MSTLSPTPPLSLYRPFATWPRVPMIEPQLLHHVRLRTPVGLVLVAGDERAVQHVRFEGARPTAPLPGSRPAGALRDAVGQLEAYFRRELTDFTVPIAPAGTAFQQRVWGELRKVPYGTTVAYGELARRIGQPSASRAVGAANGANPIPIIIPCHRAIGADGSLTGFGGGIEAKRTLLRLETGQRALGTKG